MKKTSNQAVAGRTKAVGYARVSTPEQAEKDLSLPAQMASIRRYAQDRGLALAGEFVERGVSGTDDNRPEFRRMLEEIYRPNSEVGMVIVTHGSRFMRNATRARVHKEQLRRRGIRVLAIQQTVSDDPNGHFAEGMFELIDQLESENQWRAHARWDGRKRAPGLLQWLETALRLSRKEDCYIRRTEEQARHRAGRSRARARGLPSVAGGQRREIHRPPHEPTRPALSQAPLDSRSGAEGD